MRGFYNPKGDLMAASPVSHPAPHPLRNGDQLTREEFERRYAAMPEVKKAELIEGVVFVSSPLTAEHAIPHALLGGWLLVYSASTPGTLVLDNISYRVDLRNEFQPDLVLMLSPERGGRARIDADGFLVGAPELVVEVAVSSASKDRSEKFQAYRRAGVQEYCVWLVREQVVSWWALVGGQYAPLRPDHEGVLRSRVFPGLWLDVPALTRGEARALLQRAQAGISSPEHAAFAAQA